VIEGHELYLGTRNGRFDLQGIDPFTGYAGDTTQPVRAVRH